MQNLMGAYSEAKTLYSMYKNTGKVDSEFTFIIPVYEKMESFYEIPKDTTESYPINVETTGTYIRLRSEASTNSSIIMEIKDADELNKKLYLIAETIGTQQMVEITYFVPDAKKDGGAYITCSGCVKKIDKYKHTVVMTDQTIIPIEQISDIEGEMFEE